MRRYYGCKETHMRPKSFNPIVTNWVMIKSPPPKYPKNSYICTVFT